LGGKSKTKTISEEEAAAEGLSQGFGFDPAVDQKSKEALEMEITKVEEELEAARDHSNELQSLNKKLKNLIKLKNRSVLCGRSKGLGEPTLQERARKAVGNSLAEVRAVIGRTMPSLELHLLTCVEPENGDWIYKPSPNIDWSF
jgi:predicted  nucleic acid-binding Zn-ribbon protein